MLRYTCIDCLFLNLFRLKIKDTLNEPSIFMWLVLITVTDILCEVRVECDKTVKVQLFLLQALRAPAG